VNIDNDSDGTAAAAIAIENAFDDVCCIESLTAMVKL
jgi:hypothetical protein